MNDLGHDRDAAGRRDALVDRATRLFQYLAEAQRLKSQAPRLADSYPGVLWLADLPHHPAVATVHRGDGPEPDAPLLSIDRVPRVAPPIPGEVLAQWLGGPLDDPRRAPVLRDTITVVGEREDEESDAEDGQAARQLALEDHTDVRAAYQDWLVSWQVWADRERRDLPVRDLYSRLFKIFTTATGRSEEYELVAGVGCLTWAPPNHDSVQRHLLTAPVVINLDDHTGRLTVDRADSPDPVKVELDMLDPGLTGSPRLSEVATAARTFQAHPLHRDEAGHLVRRLVHILDGDGEYRDADRAPEPAAGAIAAYAPAILLRRRTQQGLVEIYQRIVQQIADAGEVPDGLLPLMDPDHVPAVTAERADGALISVDEEPFLPLLVNEVQLRIIRQVDTKAQTLVQGPPGTGKTHTAAALLSHLLAQGQRVLVTAHTDRALKEVRDKLPAAIRPLAVSVVGTSREDMSDLRVAVERIAAAAAERDPQRTKATISSCYDTIDRLRRQRAQTYRHLVELRADEIREHHRGEVRGTLAAIAARHSTEAADHGWLAEYVSVPADEQPPLDAAELVEWLSYLRDATLSADEPEARQGLLDVTTVPEPAVFAAMVAAESIASEADRRHSAARTHPAYAAVKATDSAARQELRRRLHDLADAAEGFDRRPEAWIADALADVRSGRAGIWHARARQISELIARVQAAVQRLGHLTHITVTGEDIGPLAALAATLARHVAAGNAVKVGPDGRPKVGALTAKPVKQAQELFNRVRVNGLPPTTPAQLDSFLTWVDATWTLAALDRAWPDGLCIPDEDTLHERLQWHITEVAQLHRLVGHGAAIAAAEQHLARLRLPVPDWASPAAVRDYAALVHAADAAEGLTAARLPLQRLEELVADKARRPDTAPAVGRLLAAIQRRHEQEYAAALARLLRLTNVRRTARRRDALGARLQTAAPRLQQAMQDSAHDVAWDRRAAAFRQAWEWSATGTWLRQRETLDVNALQAEVAEVERRIRQEVEKLAASRAWGHAVAEDRLTGSARANLEQYAYLVRRHGKGTGKYAVQQRAEIRQAMDRCRPAVPVWIMPIYRIAEQLQIRPNMFDVVIVDEASQAGLEATFLQYLAPKIVVIGDDKQVSPTAVGIDRQQLRDVARKYLADDPYQASWQDPQRSLFDEAKMRFHGLLTLVEHRRCVPEIIGFSNHIAYEPDGVRLIPVRQYGNDRLEPIKPVFVADGYIRGTTTNRINPGEVDAIVDQIEKCIADPRYDGLTFGVISLLGKAQAQAIERKLLDRIPSAEWASRDLRCGDSADFQGSERDVVFLSMVAAPEPDQPMRALTGEMYVQRYNVAASRAKDQMWLFHSVPLADVGNPEDMRFRLLDYCYGVVRRSAGASTLGADAPTGCVPHDRLVEPFDSLFEQRVFNRLYDRGYTVVPQFPVEAYRIDLVVVGPKTRLAIECDGDAWHGPEAYERDLARQRELERCGWRFFRIRESAFYVDEPSVLRDLWEALAGMEIYPSGAILDAAGPTPDSPVAVEKPIPEDAAAALAAEPGHEPVEEHVLPTPVGIGVSVLLDQPVDDAPVSLSASVAVAPPIPPPAAPTLSDGPALVAYEDFPGTVPPALEASQQQIIDGIRAIVAVEGPVLGYRLHSAYVKASGGQRVGQVIAKALNRAISAAVRRGILVADNPLGESGVKPQTYRLPEQAAVRLRRLGVRDLDDVPPRELAALMSAVDDEDDWETDEALYRAVLERLGLKRLTPNVVRRLREVRELSLTG